MYAISPNEKKDSERNSGCLKCTGFYNFTQHLNAFKKKNK